DNRQPVERVLCATRQVDRARKQRRDVEIERKGAEYPTRALREDQDQREGREHLVEVVARIEPADDGDLHERTGNRGGGEACRQPEPEGTCRRRDRRTGEGAHHVERTVRQVDEPHDAEDQGQPGGHQKQHEAELEPVQELLDEKGGGHGGTDSASAVRAGCLRSPRRGRWARCGRVSVTLPPPRSAPPRKRKGKERLQAAYIWHSAT